MKKESLLCIHENGLKHEELVYMMMLRDKERDRVCDIGVRDTVHTRSSGKGRGLSMRTALFYPTIHDADILLRSTIHLNSRRQNVEQEVARMSIEQGLTWTQIFFYAAGGLASIVGSFIAYKKYRRRKNPNTLFPLP